MKIFASFICFLLLPLFLIPNEKHRFLNDIPQKAECEVENVQKVEKFRELNRRIRNCKKCRLWETRTHALPGEGNISSELMMIAQAPGYIEDREGRMFVGPSGKKLDELLEEVGIARDSIFMTNILRCVLPHYRRPKSDEIEACTPYLDREIDLINPTVISTLGYFPARYIFEKYGIGNKLEFPEVCGKVFPVGGKKILPLGHPAAMFYDSSIREGMTKNYRKLKGLLSSIQKELGFRNSDCF